MRKMSYVLVMVEVTKVSTLAQTHPTTLQMGACYSVEIISQKGDKISGGGCLFRIMAPLSKADTHLGTEPRCRPGSGGSDASPATPGAQAQIGRLYPARKPPRGNWAAVLGMRGGSLLSSPAHLPL